MPNVSAASPGSQHPPSTQSQRPAAQQPPSTQALADLLDLLSSITSSSSYRFAEEILNEVASLRSQLQSKEKELEQVRNEMSKQVTAKQTAINEMFKANEIQKLKRKEASLEIESLKKLGQEGRDALSLKDREISNFEGRYNKLQSTHTQVQSDLKTAQHDIDGLQHMVKEKDILIDKKKHSHSEIQKSLKAVEEWANKIEKEKSALSKLLQATKARLNKIKSYTAQHSDCDEDSLTDAFIDLWQYATIEAYPHLSKDLSEGILQENFKRQSNFAVEHHVPLPQSNSPAAKQMRLAIFLAILAREVDKQIFQPTYIVPEDAGIREVFANLAASDNEKESFCRSILLSINPDAQNTTLQSRVQAVIRNASSYLYGMLPNDQFDQLRVNFPVGSHAGSEPDLNILDESLVTVFPRLTVVEKGNRFPLTYVVQLRRSQPQCVAAGREVSNVLISPVIGRVASNRPCRKSTASSNASPTNGTLSGKKKSQGA
ncbi:hypothetical protein BJY00DRAFT_322747 [Aspergillus carlsbadensis]|nr:hypothetical protein BJY00DRAFT_322747 [Aspergillus carlsbadensis]